MHLAGKIENHPDYILLSEYFDEEEVERIIESGIPINQVGVVPSLQVPPGNTGCQGLDLGQILEWDPRNPLSHLSTEIKRISLEQDTSVKPVRTTVDVPAPDPALEWVESNWQMIAAGLAGLLVLGMVMKK